MTPRRALLLCLALLALAACTTETDLPGGIDSFQVTVLDGPVGSADDPVPFPDGVLTYVLRVRAVDAEGDLVSSFNGKVAVSVEPVGRLAPGQTSRLTLSGGGADQVELQVTRCHGDVTIWVEDAGGLESSGSYAVGASPVLHFANPTIAQTQYDEDIESSGLRGDFVEIRAADRQIVVTNLRRDGFYCQDLDEPDGAYAGMYVYTHNAPVGVSSGSILTALRGQVDEFFGFTELGFPDYLVGGQVTVPQPAVIDLTTLGDEAAMEALESSLVQVRDVTVCPVNDQFYEYDQWPVSLDGNCNDVASTILLSETSVFDGFDPTTMTGRQLISVTGSLRYHYLAEPSWLIIPRYRADIE